MEGYGHITLPPITKLQHMKDYSTNLILMLLQQMGAAWYQDEIQSRNINCNEIPGIPCLFLQKMCH